MAEIKNSVIIDLSGNLINRSRQYGAALGKFTNKGSRDLTRMQRSTRALGRGIDRLGNRYTALATGAGGIAAAKYAIDLERRFTRLGIQSNRTAAEMNNLKSEIFGVAQLSNIRIDPGQITSGIESIIEKTGDLDFARENMENIALAIQATGASGTDIGNMFAEFQKMGIKSKKVIEEMFDTLNVQGKEGAFTIKNFAALSPRLVSAYTAMRGASKEAMKELGAVAQVIRQGTGSSEQATTAFEALLRTMSDAEKLKALRKNGIQIFDPDELKKGHEVLRPINQIMKEIVQATGGKRTLLSGVFDAEAIRAFNSVSSEFNRTGKFASLDNFMDVKADGSVTRADSARAAKDSAGGAESISTAFKRFIADNVTKPIGDLFGVVDGAGADNIIKTGAGLTAIFGAVYAGRKLLQGGKGLMSFLSGKKGGAAGVAGSLAGAAAGVTPVFVVNMGGGMGGMPGGAGGGPRGGGARGRMAGRLGLLRSAGSLKGIAAMGGGAIGTASLAVTAAGAAGYGIGKVINDSLISGTKTSDVIGETIAKVLAFFGNDKAQAAVDRNDKAQAVVDRNVKARASLEVTVKDDRVTVSKLSADNEMDVDVDAGNMMAAM